MSSFQFPANPSDGDIVVRGNLQAFYNAATNTWRVSEVPTAPGIPGPPGPPGPIGPPGQGITVSGSVDTEADLPAPNAHQFEFWVVDDTNTLYWSDGIKWTNLGSPIQGPPGEDGEDGNEGTPGQNGRGWYDTKIIDERPANYQIQFLSNDGLGFTTDNIMGQSPEHECEPATKEDIGCIKIGAGLGVTADGTAFVDVSSTALPGGYIFSFRPTYAEFQPVEYNGAWTERQDDQLIGTEEITVDVDPDSTRATVHWFQNSGMVGNPDRNSTSGINTFMGFAYSEVECIGGEYVQGNMGVNFTHNVATHTYVGSVNERTNTITALKINEVMYPAGTTQLKFRRNCRFIRGKHVKVGFGFGRLIVTPYRHKDDGRVVRTFPAAIQSDDPNFIPPLTPDEILVAKGDDLRTLTRDGIQLAVTLLGLPAGTLDADQTDLVNENLTTLLGGRNLPGTPEEIDVIMRDAVNSLEALINFKYLFEP